MRDSDGWKTCADFASRESRSETAQTSAEQCIPPPGRGAARSDTAQEQGRAGRALPRYLVKPGTPKSRPVGSSRTCRFLPGEPRGARGGAPGHRQAARGRNGHQQHSDDGSKRAPWRCADHVVWCIIASPRPPSPFLLLAPAKVKAQPRSPQGVVDRRLVLLHRDGARRVDDVAARPAVARRASDSAPRWRGVRAARPTAFTRLFAVLTFKSAAASSATVSQSHHPPRCR